MNVSKAGWASVDITPEIGVPLGGRGPQFAGITHVIDPLFVQALVLEDHAGRQVLFVSLDLVGIGTVFSMDLRFQLATLTGVPHEAIILNFSHTHSGPMTIMDKYPVQLPIPENLAAYQQRLFDSVIEVALTAMKNIQPAEMAIHRGTSTIGVNRRNPGPTGEMDMRPNKDGFFNSDLWVLDVKAANGERCVAFNYGCHAVTVYSWQWQACSADYPGAARTFLQNELGAGVHTQFLQGFGGNIRPRQLSDFEKNEFRQSVETDHIEIGAELGGNVLTALNQPGKKLELKLAAAAGRFQAWRDHDKLLPLSHWKEQAQSDRELNRNLGRYWVDALEKGLPLAKAVPWDIGLVQLDADNQIVWMAGEVCAEWLPKLREWLADPELTALGYCQDLPSYFPTAEMIPEDGYEVGRSNWYRKTGPMPYSKRIDESARQQLMALKQKISTK